MLNVEIRHAHMFCGLGGGAKGFNRAKSIVGNARAVMRCIGGIDIDAAAIKDFDKAAGVKGTVLDLADRAQYTAIHGTPPPTDWKEANPSDIQRSFGDEHPHIVFLSAPCKGFSGLMAKSISMTDKYQAMNGLTMRGIWLMLEAYKNDPVELIVFENVPLIATRGRHLLDQIIQLLRHYGYAVAETTHDCGELGGLGQSRRRFLLVARHEAKVPAFLYEPIKRPLRSVGEILSRMPLPGDIEQAGPMHRIPSLHWKTWVRLAFVEAGSDWRSLNKLEVEDGKLRDFLIVPRNSTLFNEPSNGFTVANPKPAENAAQYQQFGVLKMTETAGAVIGVKSPGQGTFSVADPRHGGPAKHNNEFKIVPWSGQAGSITSAHGSGQCVQDPRGGTDAAMLHGKYHITSWESPTRTVIAGNANGAFSVADPRPGMQRKSGDNYLTAGHYGVIGWDKSSGAVSSSAGHDNGKWSVADPRAGALNLPMPKSTEKLVAKIESLDGTWHRPFTTLELAGLQSLYDPEETYENEQRLGIFKLDGESDQAWRERIGNAVPPFAAQAIAEEMSRTLLLSWAGETFQLNSTPIWVRQVAVALSLKPINY